MSRLIEARRDLTLQSLDAPLRRMLEFLVLLAEREGWRYGWVEALTDESTCELVVRVHEGELGP